MKNKEKELFPIIALIIGSLVMAYLLILIILGLQSEPTTAEGMTNFLVFMSLALIFYPLKTSIIINGAIILATFLGIIGLIMNLRNKKTLSVISIAVSVLAFIIHQFGLELLS